MRSNHLFHTFSIAIKFRREKAERANDPNVEYVDVEDFKYCDYILMLQIHYIVLHYRPGGKYGPLVPSTVSHSITPESQLQKASKHLEAIVPIKV